MTDLTFQPPPHAAACDCDDCNAYKRWLPVAEELSYWFERSEEWWQLRRTVSP